MNLIDKQAAIDVVHKVMLEFFDFCEDDEESPFTEKDKELLKINKKISRGIKDLQPADVAEVKHGKWLDHQNGRWIYVKCSMCETIHDTRTNFCPNCGAKMEVE